jgi:uncharacterized protein YjbI with pentapeptide repeats
LASSKTFPTDFIQHPTPAAVLKENMRVWVAHDDSEMEKVKLAVKDASLCKFRGEFGIITKVTKGRIEVTYDIDHDDLHMIEDFEKMEKSEQGLHKAYAKGWFKNYHGGADCEGVVAGRVIGVIDQIAPTLDDCNFSSAKFMEAVYMRGPPDKTEDMDFQSKFMRADGVGDADDGSLDYLRINDCVFASVEFNGSAFFNNCKFGGTSTDFSHANFSTKDETTQTTAGHGTTSFENCRFGPPTGCTDSQVPECVVPDSRITFEDAHFEHEDTTLFKGAEFTATTVTFKKAMFESKRVDFDNCTWHGSGENGQKLGETLSFDKVIFTNTVKEVLFRGSKFHYQTETSFKDAEFHASEANFNACEFTGNRTTFKSCTFGEGCRGRIRRTAFKSNKTDFKSKQPLFPSFSCL